MSERSELTNIHKRMVRDVFLNTEILLNQGDKEIFEYDIQAFMFQFLRNYLKSYSFTAGREKYKKVDCVIYQNDFPKVFYEIKTYFKPKERVKKSDFINDLTKLSELLTNNTGARAYFFTSGLTKKFETDTAKSLQFVSAHIQGDLEWKRVELDDGSIIKIRPSIKETRGQSSALSWELMLEQCH